MRRFLPEIKLGHGPAIFFSLNPISIWECSRVYGLKRHESCASRWSERNRTGLGG